MDVPSRVVFLVGRVLPSPQLGEVRCVVCVPLMYAGVGVGQGGGHIENRYWAHPTVCQRRFVLGPRQTWAPPGQTWVRGRFSAWSLRAVDQKLPAIRSH